jgi:hypothetical protein
LTLLPAVPLSHLSPSPPPPTHPSCQGDTLGFYRCTPPPADTFCDATRSKEWEDQKLGFAGMSDPFNDPSRNYLPFQMAALRQMGGEVRRAAA